MRDTGVAKTVKTGISALALCVLVGISSGLHAQAVLNQSTPIAPQAPESSSPASQGRPAVLTLDPNISEIKIDGKVFRLGAECRRRTDSEPGVYRSDACHRWYCGRVDKQDISEVMPNLAAETDCTWRIEASNLCVCRKSADSAAPGK